jgi:uncharacterized Zn-binding protein involved in type VI secretion
MSRSAAVLLAAGIVFPVTFQGTSLAQTTEPATPATSAATSGSADVLINGKPAQRAGDAPGEAEARDGSPDVLINGKPAMTGGCPPGSLPTTSPNVFINGKPAVTGCSK